MVQPDIKQSFTQSDLCESAYIMFVFQREIIWGETQAAAAGTKAAPWRETETDGDSRQDTRLAVGLPWSSGTSHMYIYDL